ncbi:MAG: hypothetical protein KJ620_10310 [Candidatus Edwardsbacteria bacterium]|nr:hypothetical protein [Candidatus Edwardsbacteria bacterium]MBU1577456.1 hypothetical protein [Candidatus Edwardsbacteria bacterium]MBU2464181.1 hypothetical protein [Candidatus Edwardsbacteria bacterium]MBU2593023.1 hypothetical protein [Candidatus Edwardsbacteria bacterium]
MKKYLLIPILSATLFIACNRILDVFSLVNTKEISEDCFKIFKKEFPLEFKRLSSAEYIFPQINRKIAVVDVSITDKKNYQQIFHRIYVYDITNKNNYFAIWKSGLIPEDCGEFDMYLTNIKAFKINGKPVIVLDLKYAMQACTTIPDIQIDSSLFYNADNMCRIFQLETHYINYNNPEVGVQKPVQARTARYWPNGVIEYNCSWITEIFYNSDKQKFSGIRNYCWNKDTTKLELFK